MVVGPGLHEEHRLDGYKKTVMPLYCWYGIGNGKDKCQNFQFKSYSSLLQFYIYWVTGDIKRLTFLCYVDKACAVVSLDHQSWLLKWAFLIVRLSVTLLHIGFLLQKHRANSNQTWHKLSFGGRDSKLFKWMATLLHKRR
jgi:hypothetical protein